jgi:hypothetical protein
MNIEQLQAAFEEQKQQFEAYKAQTEEYVQNQKILQTQWKTAEVLDQIQIKLQTIKLEPKRKTNEFNTTFILW